MQSKPPARRLMKFLHVYTSDGNCRGVGRSRSRPGLISCAAVSQLTASPQSQRKFTSSLSPIHPYGCPRLILQFWQRATEGNLPSGRQPVEGTGGGPDWQLQRWKERGVCLELPDTLLNRSLHDDGKSWVHMQPFAGKDADSSVASPRQAAETRGRIKSFWVHGVSLLFLGGLVWFSARICLCVTLLCSYPVLQIRDAPAM